MKLSFEDRVVVVTGGGGALGSAVVKQVVDAGGRCVVPVYNDAELERAEWAGDDRVRTMTNVNLCDDDRLVEFFDFAAQEPLWASIHIVGGFAMAPIVETSNADLRKQLEMNTVSAFGSVREAKRRMPKGGRIVNVAARPALFAELGSGMAAYAASKAAVAAITQAAAEEFWKDGVLVNAV
ncbi:MAG: SDR family NAD(P)-dependent oxidoreductase, partial [Planctomycetota bacterium]